MSGVDIRIKKSNNFCEQIVIIHAVIHVEDINFIDYTLSREYLVFRLAGSVNTNWSVEWFTIVKRIVGLCKSLNNRKTIVARPAI